MIYNPSQGRPRLHRGHRLVGPLPTAKNEERHYVFTTATLVSLAITAAITIATTAMQYMAAQEQAQQQDKYQRAQMAAQDRAIAENAALANRAYIENNTRLQNRQQEEDAAAATREAQVAVQAGQARSRASLAAGEGGVEGQSIATLMNDYTQQEVDYRTQSRTNLGYQRSQLEAEMSNQQITAQGRIQSMQPMVWKPVDYPSALGAGLRIAGGIGSSVAGAYANSPSTPNTDAWKVQARPAFQFGISPGD